MYALSPETLIKAYALGVFPMAEAHNDDRIFFVDPEARGILPIDAAHIPRSLRKKIRKTPYKITINQDFEATIDGCRTLTQTRQDSWINPQIRQLYIALNRLGFAYSIEVWDKQKNLVGGLYGVALAAAFFGESMFSRTNDASKIALVHLLARLKAGGFTLLDTQFINPHLKQFGAIEIPRDEFRQRLAKALNAQARMPLEGDDQKMLYDFLHASTETS